MPMIDYEREQEKTAKLRREVTYANRIAMTALAMLIIVPILYSYWSGVRVSDLHAISGIVLCPGEKLEVEYDLHVNDTAILVRDWTTYSLLPIPATKIFSTEERFIVEAESDQRIKRAWTVPEAYYNPETDETEPMAPGMYRRILAVSSPSGGSSLSTAGIDFTIKSLEECEPNE